MPEHQSYNPEVHQPSPIDIGDISSTDLLQDAEVELIRRMQGIGLNEDTL